MDAISLILSDHRRVEEVFKEYEGLSEPLAKAKRVDELIQLLEVHAEIEETLFYPEFRQASKDEDLVKEALQEHQEVKNTLKDLANADPHDTDLDSKVRRLKQLVEHHVQEEESQMLPKAKELFDQDRLEKMGEEVQTNKRRLMDENMKLRITMSPEKYAEKPQEAR